MLYCSICGSFITQNITSDYLVVHLVLEYTSFLPWLLQRVALSTKKHRSGGCWFKMYSQEP